MSRGKTSHRPASAACRSAMTESVLTFSWSNLMCVVRKRSIFSRFSSSTRDGVAAGSRAFISW